MSFSFSTVLSAYGAGGADWLYIDLWKQFFIDHRLVPQSSLWPGGLTSSGGAPFIDYNCTLKQLSDPYGIWGFEEPATRWLGGSGLMSGTYAQSFNDGTGFPSYLAMRFANNDPSVDQRPSSFCGNIRSSSDWYTANNPTSVYNQAWFDYIQEVRDYLNGLGLLGQSYHYMANEPQDVGDYAAIAWYSKYLKQAAPDLRLMVSEEPKPEIFGHADYVSSGQVDIWLTYMQFYDAALALDRESNHGEESWLYFLQQTVSPYLNPYTIDHPGVDSRLLGWLFWKYRIRGLSHYAAMDWSSNPWTTPASSSRTITRAWPGSTSIAARTRPARCFRTSRPSASSRPAPGSRAR